ncbi:MAG: phosphate acyltransferase [Lachnospiraceae bacterium]|nr:phosphate acyltransferase [Lachnospiraceae bacterium]
MNEVFEKEFDVILDKALSLKKPARAVIAGAEVENLLQGAFEAEKKGFIIPVLVGNEERIRAMLDQFGLTDRQYEICAVDDDENVVQYAIDVIQSGSADILMRGNTPTRDFLMPILHKGNKLLEKEVATMISLMKFPNYDKLLALSDVAVLVQPSVEKRKLVIKNMVDFLNLLGVEQPNIAVLSLVEKPSFHMRDTVEAQSLVRDHNNEPIANCNLVGPITWDLIVSKEAARLKNFDCPYCGEFDGICVPDVMAGNILMKALQMSAQVNSCGIIMGTKIPIAINSRSNSVEQAFLSLATCAAMLKAKGRD